MSELIKIEELKAEEVFKVGGIDPILEVIKSKVTGFIPDLTTENGKAEVKSRAYMVARFKTAIDSMGKALADDLNAKLKPINSERKKARDFLDALKDEVRKPLTDMENRERERVENLNKRLLELNVDHALNLSIAEMGNILKSIEDITIDDSWQEYHTQAHDLKFNSVNKLKGAILLKRQEDEEREKALKAQKEKEAQERKEREEKIKKDAEERAEKQRIEAAKKAEEDKARAVEAERLRIEAEQKAKEDAELKRSEDLEHRRKINNDVLDRVCSWTTNRGAAQCLVAAIIKNEIPHIKIQY